jgi:hypothetical protein
MLHEQLRDKRKLRCNPNGSVSSKARRRRHLDHFRLIRGNHINEYLFKFPYLHIVCILTPLMYLLATSYLNTRCHGTMESDCSIRSRDLKRSLSRRTLLLLLCLTPIFAAQPAIAGQRTPDPTVTAYRLPHDSPGIDGALVEQVWWDAPVHTGFTQNRPLEGEPASELTTVQVAYDKDALYVGVEAYDSDPDGIVARLTRRDQSSESDWVEIHLDPYNDKQTGYYFRLNAAGIEGDGYLYDDTREDDTWDGIWQGNARIHDSGWTAEFRIPYRVLRFSERENQTWGINVIRNISRKNERDHLRMVPNGANGWVSHFGHLEGIQGVAPSLPLEVIPYTTSRLAAGLGHSEQPSSFGSNLGADIRYGVTPNVTLTATVNPDFGQVEADPSVLNLSSFETHFQERRPFFVEGGQFYDTPIDLFYSPRVGRRPGHLDTPDEFDEDERPDNTTILAAAKISGKTRSGTSFGLLEAVTAPEYAYGQIEANEGGSEELTNRDSKQLVESTTSYLVGRVRQDVLKGNSSIGAMVTATNRTEGISAYTGGADWNILIDDNAYRFRGQIAASQTDRDGGRGGYAGVMEAARRSGWVRAGVEAEVYSPGFDANDLGFVRRSGRTSTQGWVQFRKLTPWKLSRRLFLSVRANNGWNYEGLTLQRHIRSSGWIQFRNYWWLNYSLSRGFQTLDDRATRGGPAVVDPAWTGQSVAIESDDRSAVSFEAEFDWWQTDDGNSYGRSIESGIVFRPTANVALRFSPEYRWKRNHTQWVENVDGADDSGDDTYVFGELRSRVIDLTTRASITFSRNLSLQLYVQPFVATGSYDGYKKLAAPESYAFAPYAPDENHDFSRRSLKSNMILRWEYGPGSTLFVVWSQSRNHKSDYATFRPLDNVRDSFSDDGTNVLMAKVSHWIGL